ncbi:MAG: acylphosphatase [Alphaproteobacteria bacterium]|nr:acylphosphatase [Alphaproteobacteria bacterium]MBQ2810800.1 acylphosphatase [Alphaproteobacteria bacterium]
MIEVYLKISGRVQGVGFRRWAQKEALKIGNISGWVRNCDDRSVEILMRGRKENVEEMIQKCHKGPLCSRVDEVKFLPAVTNHFLPLITDGVFDRI